MYKYLHHTIMFLSCSSIIPSGSGSLFKPLDNLMDYEGGCYLTFDVPDDTNPFVHDCMMMDVTVTLTPCVSGVHDDM